MATTQKISDQSILIRLTELYTESVTTGRAKPYGGIAGTPGDANTLGTAIVQCKLLVGERHDGAKNKTYRWFNNDKAPSLAMAKQVMEKYKAIQKKYSGNIPPRGTARSRVPGDQDIEALLVLVNQRLERMEAKIDALGKLWEN